MKKLLCALLCVMMVFCMMPTMAFADGEAVVTLNGTGYASLDEAIAAANGETVVIELLQDATLNYGAREAYGDADTKTITINGNGHTLTMHQTNTDWSSFGMTNPEGKTIINDLTINKTSAGGNNAWNNHAINWYCNVEMNNVTVNNAVAFAKDADLDNVTVNEAGNFYAIWIQAAGKIVDIANSTISAPNGRCIKIGDQYVDTPASVTLGISNTSFESVNKAAVLVTSPAGASITASNVDISKVAADSANLVWLDDDYKETEGAKEAVTVTGANFAYEGGQEVITWVPVATVNGTEYKTLDEAFENITGEHAVIELLQNAALNYGAREAYGTAETKSITINGNGHTLTMNQTNNDWSSFGMSNPEGKTIINDITINKTGYGATNGAWNKHTINWFCAVEMNDVTVNNSVAFRKDAQLNDVTVNESNGDFYAVWIYAEGQTVDVDGLTVISTGRGIKIDEEYVDDVKVVKLNLDNANFTTAKKSAIIVKSEAGAVITLGNNVDISGVAKDAFYAVWVDEDAAAHADKVIVNNGFKAIEGQVPAAPTFDAGVLKSNADDEYFICFEAHNLKNAKVKVELYSGTKLLVAKEHTNKFNGTVTGNFYTVRTTGTSWTETPDTWTAYDCVVPTHAVLYVDGTKARECDVKFTSDEWIAFAGTAEHTYVNGVCPGCGAIEPVVPTPPSYGGGYVYIEKPEITADAGADYELSILGSTLKVAAKEGYEVVDVLLNGVSQGAVAELKGLETGDKVVIVTKAIGAEEPAEDEVQLVARSARGKVKGKNAIKLTWYAEDGSELNYDGYEIFRSTKRYSGFGKKPIFTTTRTTYWNTAVESGVKYFYKVRGFNVVDGEKVYSDWSLKAWRVAE